jgi:ribonuclease D
MPLINQQNQLQEICNLIIKHKITAIDTEFIRENTYLPILCLIQINVVGKCYVVDALSQLDLSPFLSIINNPEIVKIFHSSRQDLEILIANFPNQIFPKNIFDTQIMAALCGLGSVASYSKLAKDLLGKEVCKDLQRSNWQERPLHPRQIEYAQTDVLYLSEIYQILKVKLVADKKISWANEEMNLNIQKAINDNNLFKNFSLISKKPIYCENIILLVNWRDKTAQKHNVPRSFVFKDNILQIIAASNPNNIEELEKCNIKTRISNSKFKENFLSEIVELLNNKPKNLSLEKLQPKIIFKLNQNQKDLYQQARTLLQSQAEKHQINPELIINQTNLQQIISGNKSIDDVLRGWRFEVFGEELRNLVS